VAGRERVEPAVAVEVGEIDVERRADVARAEVDAGHVAARERRVLDPRAGRGPAGRPRGPRELARLGPKSGFFARAVGASRRPSPFTSPHATRW
jgi:hypothetical protein